MQDRIRQAHKELLRSARTICPTTRILEFVCAGLSSKNSRTRVDCAEFLTMIISEEGMTCLSKLKDKPFGLLAAVPLPTILLTHPFTVSIKRDDLKIVQCNWYSPLPCASTLRSCKVHVSTLWQIHRSTCWNCSSMRGCSSGQCNTRA